MTQKSIETQNRQDLSGHLAGVPAEVIAALGEAAVIRLESSQDLVDQFCDLARQPNPFAGKTRQPGPPLPGEIEAMLDELEVIFSDIQYPPDKAVEESKKQAAAFYPEVTARLKNTSTTLNDIAKGITASIKEIESSEPVPTEEYVDFLERTHNSLARYASQLPGDPVFKSIKRLLEGEYKAGYNLLVAAGGMRNPDLYRKFLHVITGRRNQATRDQSVEVMRALAFEGVKGRKVRKAYRQPDKIEIDEQYAADMVKFLDKQVGRGTTAHESIIINAREAAKPAARSIFDEIWAASNAGSLRPSAVAKTGDTATAVALEEYFAAKATFVEAAYRQIGIGLDPEGRRMMHELKDTKVKRGLNRLAEVVMSERSPYEAVDPDPNFRKQCRDLRDLLVGGGRLEFPEAKRLADELHKLTLANGSRLEPEEAGLIIGILSGKTDSVLNIAKRFEKAKDEVDEQIEKLKLDANEQYKLISQFSLESTARQLKSLLNTTERTAILDILKNQDAEIHLLDGLDQIIAHYEPKVDIDEGDETAEEAGEEVSAEEEPQAEYDEDLAIINEDYADIAEQLEWLVFPAGTRLTDIRRALATSNVDTTKVNWDRIGHLIHLANEHSGKIYRSYDPKLGTRVPYLVAEVQVHGHRIAVAECPEIGNATYVVDEQNAAGSWEEVMRLPKADARSLGARRVIHPKEEGHLAKIIRTINSLLTASR